MTVMTVFTTCKRDPCDHVKHTKGTFRKTLLRLKIYNACNVYYRFSTLNYVTLNSVSPNAIKIASKSCCRVSRSAKICDENPLQLSLRGHVSSSRLARQINRVSPKRDGTLTDPVSVRKADRQRDCAQDHARPHADQLYLSFQKTMQFVLSFYFSHRALTLPASEWLSHGNRSAIGLRSSVGTARATGEHESEEPMCEKFSFSSRFVVSYPTTTRLPHFCICPSLCLFSPTTTINFLPVVKGLQALIGMYLLLIPLFVFIIFYNIISLWKQTISFKCVQTFCNISIRTSQRVHSAFLFTWAIFIRTVHYFRIV